MPNPSTEAAILEAELVEQKTIALNRRGNYSKSEREASLRRVRQLEEQLGLPSEPYNSNRFAAASPTTRPARIRQTPTAILLPFDGREFLLTKGQRAILVDALTIVLSDNFSNDPDIDQEREMLINLFKQA